jgi:nucleoside-diphosphate-sugar epimerase
VNALGCFGGRRPAQYLPIDDAYPRHPLSAYQLSKHLVEETCRAFSDRYGLITVCLRPVYVAEPREYRPDWRRPEHRTVRHEYWSYVDIRDVCRAALLGLSAPGIAHDAFLLAADDTLTDVPTAELVDRYYPDTPWSQMTRDTYLTGKPHRSLIDCAHAKAALGWSPRHSWREGTTSS